MKLYREYKYNRTKQIHAYTPAVFSIFNTAGGGWPRFE